MIRASYVPQYQIEDYLKSFYIGLPASFKQVLDSIFEEGFLEGDAIDTYEKNQNYIWAPHEWEGWIHLSFMLLSKQNYERDEG